MEIPDPASREYLDRHAQFLRSDRRDRWITGRLREIVRQAKNSGFYKERFWQLDEGSRDFRIEDIPISNKEMILRHTDGVFCDPKLDRSSFDQFFSLPFDFDRRLHGYHAFHTTGSTGLPGYVAWTERELSLASSMWYFFDQACDGPADSVLRANRERGRRLSYIGILDDYVGGNSWFFDLRRLADTQLLSLFEQPANLADDIRDFRPHVVVSKPGVLADLAPLLAGDGLPLDYVVGVGEKCAPGERQLIEQELGVPLLDSYSLCETGPIARQGLGSDGLSVFASELIVELVDGADRPIREPAVPGRIVVTNLYNRTSPAIRYDTGDVAEWRNFDDQRLGSVLGRATARMRFVVDGHEFSIMEFAFWSIAVPGLTRYKVVQTAFDQLLIRYTSREPVDEQLFGDRIRRLFHPWPLADRVGLTFARAERIEADRNGKFRITVPYNG